MSTYPSVPSGAVPWLTIDQMVEADRLAIEEFDISLLQMMEHAGSNLARLVNTLAPEGTVTVLAGGGNNGGGGLCAARHLTNSGRQVRVVLSSDRIGPAPAHHLGTLAAMGIEPVEAVEHEGPVVDAMVGYGLASALRGRARGLAAITADAFTVSLDFPSGHGFPGAVDADATMTLALPKEGLRGIEPLYLADLGLPASLWMRMGLDVPPVFADARVVQLTR